MTWTSVYLYILDFFIREFSRRQAQIFSTVQFEKWRFKRKHLFAIVVRTLLSFFPTRFRSLAERKIKINYSNILKLALSFPYK